MSVFTFMNRANYRKDSWAIVFECIRDLHSGLSFATARQSLKFIGSPAVNREFAVVNATYQGRKVPLMQFGISGTDFQEEGGVANSFPVHLSGVPVTSLSNWGTRHRF
jgi:hypothetical protein